MPSTLLTDETWARLLPILKQHGVYGKSTLRNTVEGILYRIRVGCPWRDIPAEFGCHNSIYCTFRRWVGQKYYRYDLGTIMRTSRYGVGVY